MKLVKIFGVVVGVHAAAFMFIFAIPGCRSIGKKSGPAAPVTGAAGESPVAVPEAGAPIAATAEPATADVAVVRFSPTRPGTALATEVATPAQAPVVGPVTYTVIKGDNLWTIAKKNNITVKQLTGANNMRTDSRLSLGQKLVIPGKAATPATGVAKSVSTPVSTPAAAAVASTTHVVKSGESLGGIARKYQIKVGDIATANNIADPTKIRVGQILKITGAHSAVAKPVSSATTPAAKATPAAPAEVPAPVPASSPVFSSPLIEQALISPAAESPLVTPANPTTEAPVISVEESGAPKVQ